jgi:hypothetical protein
VVREGRTRTSAEADPCGMTTKKANSLRDGNQKGEIPWGMTTKKAKSKTVEQQSGAG